MGRGLDMSGLQCEQLCQPHRVLSLRIYQVRPHLLATGLLMQILWNGCLLELTKNSEALRQCLSVALKHLKEIFCTQSHKMHVCK